MHATRRLASLLPAAAALAWAAACVTPPPPAPPEPTPLVAPAPTPPGDLGLEERILWYEARLPRMAAEDRAEALIHLGQMYLEAERPEEARRCFREISISAVSRAERARAELGMGLAYLLEELPAMALPHLAAAEAELEAGPQREECAILLAFARDQPLPPEATPLALERLRPYFGRRFPEPRAPVAAPAVALVDLSRRDWGARPTGANHDPMGKIWRITVHHSAEPIESGSPGATIAEVKRIQKSHQTHQPTPWADIGYHYLIDRAGRVVEGRPIEIQGAHAGGDFNRGNIGVCLLGNFAAHPGDGPQYARAQAPTPEQLAALGSLLERLREKYGIRRDQVWPHNHFRVTECPGPALERWIERYRAGSDLGISAP